MTSSFQWRAYIVGTFVCFFFVPASALAAITYVGGQVGSSAGSNSNTTVTFSLTGGSNATPQAGDLVIISFSNGDTANKTLTVTNASAVSYTIASGADLYQNGTSFDSNFIVGYRFMPGTPETSALIGGGDTSGGRAWSVHVFRGVDSGTPLDVAAVTAGATGTHLVNPGAILPITSGAIIYVAGAGATNTGANYTAAYLTDLRTASGADTQDGTVGSGYVTWASGTYDPAAFGGGGTDSSGDSWNAVTLALRPSPTVPTISTDSANSFTPTSANLFGSISNTGGQTGAGTDYGFAISQSSTLSSGVSSTSLGTYASTGSFNYSTTTLSADQTYYYRAYASNSGGFGYGSILSFTTGNNTPTRRLLIFAGFILKLISGKIKLMGV